MKTKQNKFFFSPLLHTKHFKSHQVMWNSHHVMKNFPNSCHRIGVSFFKCYSRLLAYEEKTTLVIKTNSLVPYSDILDKLTLLYFTLLFLLVPSSQLYLRSQSVFLLSLCLCVVFFQCYSALCLTTFFSSSTTWNGALKCLCLYRRMK